MNEFCCSNKLDNRVALLFHEKGTPRRQAQKAGDYFWPQSIPIPIPLVGHPEKPGIWRLRLSISVPKSVVFGNIGDRARARVRSAFSFFLFFYSFFVFAQTGYLRHFSTRSFVARNDRFFVLLYSVVFHCPYLLSLFLPDAVAAPPYFHAFDLTTRVPPPIYFQW